MHLLFKKITLLILVVVLQQQICISAMAEQQQAPDEIMNQILFNQPEVVEQDVYQPTQVDELNTQKPFVYDLPMQTTEDSILIEVLQAMKQQQWQQAMLLLSPEVSKKNANMHLLFLAGQVSERLLDYQSAINYYHLMLATNSNLPRPRFELARMQYNLKQMQPAEKNFRLVLAQSPPNAVVLEINRYLTAIKKQKVSWQLGFNILPSTNINNGSDNGTVIINGKEFVLSEDAKAKTGIGVRGFLAGQYQFGSELQWFVDGVLQHTDYVKETNDSTFLRSRVGHTWRYADQRIKASVGYQDMQYQHRQLYKGWVTSLNYQKELTQKLRLNTTFELQELDYVDNYDYLDATQTRLNINVNHYKNGNTMYRYGLQLKENNTEDPTESYHNAAIEFDLIKQLNWHALTTNVGVSLNTTKYEAKNPFFAIARQDKEWGLSAGILKRDWSWFGFAPKVSVNYEINDSNIPRYQHTNTSLDIAFTKDF